MTVVNSPLYLKIYNYLLDEIKAMKYNEGKRLPSEKDLSEMFNVSRITAKKALEMLTNEGIIIRMPGKGSYINEGKKSEIQTEQIRNNNVTKKKIGVIIPDFSESYGIGLISGIEKECLNEGWFMITRRSYGQIETEESAIDEFIEFGVDGLIIMPIHNEYYNPKIIKLILEGFPVVIMDRQMAGIKSAFVGSDNIKAAFDATAYLFKIGHEKICFLSPPVHSNTAIEDRENGIIKFYSDNNVALDKSLFFSNLTSTMPGQTTKDNIEKDINQIKEHLELHPEITAIFAAEYNIAILAQEALSLLGKNVPDDIEIICFDTPRNIAEKYNFTHIRQQDELIGQKAIELIKSQIDHNSINEEFSKILIDTQIILGLSTKNT